MVQTIVTTYSEHVTLINPKRTSEHQVIIIFMPVHVYLYMYRPGSQD